MAAGTTMATAMEHCAASNLLHVLLHLFNFGCPEGHQCGHQCVAPSDKTTGPRATGSTSAKHLFLKLSCEFWPGYHCYHHHFDITGGSECSQFQA